MADSPASTTGSTPTESPAQEKARLRRERRAAKITAGGASRLQAITAVQGGSHRDIEKDVPAKPTPTPSPQPAPTPPGISTPDPEEIDISQHHYTPASQPRLPSPFAFDGNSAPPFPPGQPSDPSQDPMMAMLQQMMGAQGGGMPGGPGQAGGQAGDLPPGLANLFSAMQGGSAPEPPPDQSSAWVWRLVHALFSLGLAIYIVLQTTFTGSKLARTSPSAPADEDWVLDGAPPDSFSHFFYLFATFEVVLQSSRYFTERGRLQGSGILSSIGSMLPEPYAGLLAAPNTNTTTIASDTTVL